MPRRVAARNLAKWHAYATRLEDGRTTVATTEQSTGNEPNPALGDFGANEWLVEDMYERYLANPSSVDEAWHEFFADFRGGAPTDTAPAEAVPAAPPAAAAAAPVAQAPTPAAPTASVAAAQPPPPAPPAPA